MGNAESTKGRADCWFVRPENQACRPLAPPLPEAPRIGGAAGPRRQGPNHFQEFIMGFVRIGSSDPKSGFSAHVVV